MLKHYGFTPGKYGKIIVTWGWTKEAGEEAANLDIELWDFRELMREIAEAIEQKRSYFTDDTLRTLHLFVNARASKNGGGEQ